MLLRPLSPEGTERQALLKREENAVELYFRTANSPSQAVQARRGALYLRNPAVQLFSRILEAVAEYRSLLEQGGHQTLDEVCAQYSELDCHDFQALITATHEEYRGRKIRGALETAIEYREGEAAKERRRHGLHAAPENI